jgi:hypothetical protein
MDSCHKWALWLSLHRDLFPNIRGSPDPPRNRRQMTRGAWDLCGARDPLESAQVSAACEGSTNRDGGHLHAQGIPGDLRGPSSQGLIWFQ